MEDGESGKYELEDCPLNFLEAGVKPSCLF